MPVTLKGSLLLAKGADAQAKGALTGGPVLCGGSGEKLFSGVTGGGGDPQGEIVGLMPSMAALQGKVSGALLDGADECQVTPPPRHADWRNSASSPRFNAAATGNAQLVKLLLDRRGREGEGNAGDDTADDGCF
jgi:hypothetical protein